MIVMHAPGITGIILIVLIALLLFGPNKLPELGRAFGKTLREFKKGASDMMNEEDQKPGRTIVQEDTSKLEDHADTTPQKPGDSRRLPD
jgi:sec-independent protein translocase protein TatA